MTAPWFTQLAKQFQDDPEQVGGDPFATYHPMRPQQLPDLVATAPAPAPSGSDQLVRRLLGVPGNASNSGNSQPTPTNSQSGSSLAAALLQPSDATRTTADRYAGRSNVSQLPADRPALVDPAAARRAGLTGNRNAAGLADIITAAFDPAQASPQVRAVQARARGEDVPAPPSTIGENLAAGAQEQLGGGALDLEAPRPAWQAAGALGTGAILGGGGEALLDALPLAGRAAGVLAPHAIPAAAGGALAALTNDPDLPLGTQAARIGAGVLAGGIGSGVTREIGGQLGSIWRDAATDPLLGRPGSLIPPGEYVPPTRTPRSFPRDMQPTPAFMQPATAEMPAAIGAGAAPGNPGRSPFPLTSQMDLGGGKFLRSYDLGGQPVHLTGGIGPDGLLAVDDVVTQSGDNAIGTANMRRLARQVQQETGAQGFAGLRVGGAGAGRRVQVRTPGVVQALQDFTSAAPSPGMPSGVGGDDAVFSPAERQQLVDQLAAHQAKGLLPQAIGEATGDWSQYQAHQRKSDILQALVDLAHQTGGPS